MSKSIFRNNMRSNPSGFLRILRWAVICLLSASSVLWGEEKNVANETVKQLVEKTAESATEVKITPQMIATAHIIRAEATRKNLDPEGRPLPLVSHWHRASTPLEFQLQLIGQGHHIFPWAPMPTPQIQTNVTTITTKSPEELAVKAEKVRKSDAIFKMVAELKLPISFISQQWEGSLYETNLPWRSLPPEKSPLVVPATPLFGKDGALKPTAKMISPFGSVEPWRELGKYWIDNPGMKKLQELYPDPSLVLLISNNEAGRLKKPEEDKNYLTQYGAGKSDEVQQKAMDDGWAERYGAMIKSMRESLTSEGWRKNSRFIAYNAFGHTTLGKKNSKVAYDDGRGLSWQWHTWEGAVPESYDNIWQGGKALCNVFSCQTESMNIAFLKELCLKTNPDFWLERIFWDGDRTTIDDQGKVIKYSDRGRFYNDMGFPLTPERFRGWTQYVMWMDTPRVARDWRGSAFMANQWWSRFAELIRAVDLVYADPVLTKFWRKGILVSNPEVKHPWGENIPEKYKDTPRWFHLSTNLDPKQPWKDTTRMPVYTLARVMGERPSREWLIYGHGTLEDHKRVQIHIPTFKAIEVDLLAGGSFYHVKEKDGSITSVGDISKVPLAAYDMRYIPKSSITKERIISAEDQKAMEEIDKEGYLHFEKNKPGSDNKIASVQVNVPEDGDYIVWILVRGKPRESEWNRLSLGINDRILSQTFDSQEWQWVYLKLSNLPPAKGEPKAPPANKKVKRTLKLSKGFHVFQLEITNADEKDVGLLVDCAGMMLATDADFIPKAIRVNNGNGITNFRFLKGNNDVKLSPLGSWKTGVLPVVETVPEDGETHAPEAE